MSQTEQSTLSGGAMGAAGGALIGAMAGNAGMGAAIGGEGGLTGGYLYGTHKESEQKASQQGYQQGQQSRSPRGQTICRADCWHMPGGALGRHRAWRLAPVAIVYCANTMPMLP
jgi:osmotically inducible lipoprotein OsmB